MGLKGLEDRLAKARKEKGFTQEELALRLGVTPQAVSKWERGTGYPDLEMLSYICEILDCSTDYMLHRDATRMRLTESNDEQQKKQLLQNLLAEPLVVEVGTGLVDLLVKEHKDNFPSIQALREKMAILYGVLLPVLRIRDNEKVGLLEYRIMAYDQVLYSETITNVTAISFQDICVRLEKVTLENFSKMINRQMVKTLVDNIADKYPAVVQDLIPEKISLSLLQKVLSGLVEKGKSIRNLIKVIELLEDEAEYTKDEDQLIELILKRIYN